MLELLRNKRILLVVAHPDDELLGPGGTMHHLIKNFGTQIHVSILGEGITSRSEMRDVEKWQHELDVHRANITSAQRAIGFQSFNAHATPDNRFDSVDLLDIVKIIEKEKRDFEPDYIFTHHGGDLNIDHQRTFEAVITATRPLENETVKGVFTFETPSGTEWRASSDPKHFIPNMFVRLSKEDVEAKIKGMESYEFEKRSYPHPRSPEALEILAKRWGIVIGSEYAEAFMVIRLIS